MTSEESKSDLTADAMMQETINGEDLDAMPEVRVKPADFADSGGFHPVHKHIWNQMRIKN